MIRAFSATVRFGQSDSSWKTQRSPEAWAAATEYAPDRSVPAISMTPSSGASTPASTFIRVDLPAPLWPTRPTHSPASTRRSTPLSARTAPYDFLDALETCQCHAVSAHHGQVDRAWDGSSTSGADDRRQSTA